MSTFRRHAGIAALALLTSFAAPTASADSSATKEPSKAVQAAERARVHYRTMEIEGVNVFYREAGAADAPVIVLLHGFPTSSNMFRNLIPSLATRYRVIAPDYPGFGQSDAPDRSQFEYTFAHYAEITRTLLNRLNAPRYALYIMDYGSPVGLRVALAEPKKVTALVVQSGNAYEEGLKEFWDPLRAYWKLNSEENREALRAATTLDAIRWQYLHGVKDVSRIDPSTWLHDRALLDRPGNVEIQLDLFYDYRTNVELYPRFQQFFRDYQPPTLIVWGRNDEIFPAEGAKAYLRDLPKAELHLLDAGHFALEDQDVEITRLMLDFLGRTLKR
jgi:pimeloyl-ACP methyl ester carboxylesterase